MTERSPNYFIVAPPPPEPARVFDPCTKSGFPPPRLKHWRWPHQYGAAREAPARLVAQESFEEIATRLARAPVGLVQAGRRCVRLWGVFEISVDARGGNLHGKYLEPVDQRAEVTADLRRPLGQTWWVDAFAPIVREAQSRRGWPRSPAISANTWLRTVLGSSFRPCLDFRALRRQALNFLQLDQLTLSVCNRIFPGARVEAGKFNWVGDNLHALALVAVEHPRLLPFLFPLSFGERPVGLDALDDAAQAYATHGMLPAAFRKLERWGWDAFEWAANTSLFVDARRVVAEIANALHRLGISGEAPRLFGYLLGHGLEAGGPPHAEPRLEDILPDWFLRALYEACMDDDMDDDDEAHVLLHAQFLEAFAWLQRANPAPDANQKRAGWRWIVEQAAREAVAREAVAQEEPGPPRWSMTFEDYVEGGYRIVALRDAASLAEEARAMKNCLHRYDHACATGRIAVFSIREAGSDKRVACLSAEKRFDARGMPCWELGQLHGYANSDASWLFPVAQGAVRRLSSGLDPRAQSSSLIE